MNIQSLLLTAEDEESNEYKEGWCNAVCYINDNFIITERNGTPITITFDIGVDENELIKNIIKGQEQCKKNEEKTQKMWERLKRLIQIRR